MAVRRNGVNPLIEDKFAHGLVIWQVGGMFG